MKEIKKNIFGKKLIKLFIGIVFSLTIGLNVMITETKAKQPDWCYFYAYIYFDQETGGWITICPYSEPTNNICAIPCSPSDK